MHAHTPMSALEGPERKPARRDARTFSRSMVLSAAAKSPEAQALMTTSIDTTIAPHRAARGQLRPSMLPRYRQALGPFLGDLLAGARVDKWSKLRTNTQAIAGYPGGPTAFKAMRGAMGADGLLEELPGYYRKEGVSDDDDPRWVMTSFRPTPQLIAMAERHGVVMRGLGNHFKVPKGPVAAVNVVEARAAKAAKGDRAKRFPVDPEDPTALTITGRMERLNAYLMEDGRIDGIVFAGLRRVFSNADQPGFRWQWGGRFYSMPCADAYENMDGGAASRIAAIRIDGEEVAEVDISAAHLTILHGLLGIPFDASADPYAFPGLDREEVKRWVKYALGASDAAIGGTRYAKVRRAGLEHYPALATLQAHGITTHDLQYHEAEIMLMAMEELMDQHGIGFLPVHDALMVARSKRDLAADVLKRAFRRYFVERLGLGDVGEPMVR